MACFGLLAILLAAPALARAETTPDCAIDGACCFPGATPRPVASPAAPSVKLAEIRLGPSALSRPTVKRVLASRTAALSACRLGRITAHLVIAPSGAVVVTRTIAVPPLGHPGEAAAIERCTTAALEVTRFPASAGVTELDATFAR